jgi:uncharacterized phage protein (TIGR01671 family)
MNREILFRGQTPEGKWVEGFLCRYKIGELFPLCIQVLKEWDTGDYMEYYEVLPETVGQFTGRTDKNGKRIFEGDLVKCKSLSNGIETVLPIHLHNGAFRFYDRECEFALLCDIAVTHELEIIDNVYEEEK